MMTAFQVFDCIGLGDEKDVGYIEYRDSFFH